MESERFLIVNADDLGLAAGVNEGILRAHEQGIVTSASLMVRRPAAAEAARLAKAHPRLGVGLHLELGQWDYAEGEWAARCLRCDPGDEAAVEAECRAQLEAFRGIVGDGPTHIDSHQHVHDSEPASSVTTRLAAEIGVPLRGRQIRYEGGFYGQTGRGEPVPGAIAPERLVELIHALPAGWTELGCHPGLGATAVSSYGRERELEVGALCDPAVIAACAEAGVRLRTFAEFRSGSSPRT
jgi:predicted glycoside hydrolase/deacetylase ChbG (UPF0249 family)